MSYSYPYKKIDLYEVARIDPELPIETIMINLITLRDDVMDIHSLSEYKKDLIAANTQLGVAGLAHSPLGPKLLTGTITKSFADDLSEGDYRARSNRFPEDTYYRGKSGHCRRIESNRSK
ncbi:hypothetical protein GGU11DRAFT_758657 [Lentinula aff. detonsa]|nr:hypothetical protein GGU11DRAFT_758657 [Lentinula aff. detonsa]